MSDQQEHEREAERIARENGAVHLLPCPLCGKDVPTHLVLRHVQLGPKAFDEGVVRELLPHPCVPR